MNDGADRPTLQCGIIDFEYNRNPPYKAPFKISCMAWNPIHREMLALGSNKGDVMTKRAQWRKAWKTNVEDFNSPLFERVTGSQEITSLCWCPDGDVLAVGTDNGFLYLLDYECGQVLFAWRVSEASPVIRMRWTEGKGCDLGDLKRKKGEDDEKAWMAINQQELFNAHENPSKYSLETGIRDKLKSAQKLQLAFHRSLVGTYLTVMLELKVQVLAAGIMLLAELEPPADFFEKHNLFVVSLDDAVLQQNNSGEMSINAVYTSHGKPPFIGRGLFLAIENVQPATSEAQASAVSHLLSVKSKGLNMKGSAVWKLSRRFSKLYVSMLTVNECFETCANGWKHEIRKIAEKFEDPEAQEIDFADLFLVAAISGCPSNPWLERTVGPQGSQEMRDCLDKKLSEVLMTIRCCLLPAVELLSFNLVSFKQEWTNVEEEVVELDWETQLFPPRNEDVSVYPVGGLPKVQPDELINKLVTVSASAITAVRRLHAAAVKNYSDLSTLIHFMSLLDPLLKTPNRAPHTTMDILRQCRMWDYDDIMDLITREFMSAKEGDLFRRYMFDVENVIKEIPGAMGPVFPGQNDIGASDQFLTPEHLNQRRKQWQRQRDRDRERIKQEALAIQAQQKMYGSQDSLSGASTSSGPSTPVATIRPPRPNPHHHHPRKQFQVDKISVLFDKNENQSIPVECPVPHPDEVTAALRDHKDILGIPCDYDVKNIVTMGTAMDSLRGIVREVFNKTNTHHSDRTVNWVHALRSGIDFAGYESFLMTPLKWNRNKDPLEAELEYQLEELARKISGLNICAVESARATLFFRSESRCYPLFDKKIKLQKPLNTVCRAYVREERHPKRYLPVVAANIGGSEQLGRLVKFVKMVPMAGGFFYALCLFETSTGQSLKKFVKGSFTKPELLVHVVNEFVSEEVDDFCVSDGNGYGVVLSEEGARVTWFEMLPEDEMIDKPVPEGELRKEANPQKPTSFVLENVFAVEPKSL